MNEEAQACDLLLPTLGEQLELAVEDLQRINPELKSQRTAYTELLSRRSSVESALRILSTISELEERRTELESSPQTPPQSEAALDLSLSTLNSFSKVYEEVLKSWNLPDIDRVYFEQPSRDFVISGKPRSARGKGMRALSYAALPYHCWSSLGATNYLILALLCSIHLCLRIGNQMAMTTT